MRLLREQGRVSENTIFPLVVPWEPSKQELEDSQTGSPVPRRILVVAYDTVENKTYEALVRLTSPAALESWTLVPGVQPPLSTWDADKAQELVRQDERWHAALRRRGVTRPEQISFDTWAMGPSDNPQLEGHRLVKTLFFFKADTAYIYARPVEGLVALVDLTDRKVVELIDRGDVPIPQGVGAYDEQSVGFFTHNPALDLPRPPTAPPAP